MSINTELTALADAIRAKSGTSGKLSISGMTTAVNNIVINAGDDIDLSGVTVTADKMLSGIVAVGATGEKVTGNIQTVTATSDGTTVTVPVGYIASEQTFDVGSDGYDTSAVTATADTMLAGKVAIGKNGETITGNIATVTPNLSGRTFTVAKGYVAENFEASVPEATVTETESKVTISTGYVSSELSYDLGGGIDTTTSVPPSAADVRLGKEFWANGAKYTGAMPDAVVTVEDFDGGDYAHKLTISAGFLENDFELEYNTSAVVSLPFVTATAADIREGMVGADSEGNPVYGTLVVGGDTPAPASSAIYRCTELVSHPDDIIVSAGTWVVKSFKENAGVATEVERAFSLVGEYKLVDPTATGRLRQWVCESTVPCVVDGQQCNSVKSYIYFNYDHGIDDTVHTQIDSWCIFAEEADGHKCFLFCQDQNADAEENSPDEVTNWTGHCGHSPFRQDYPEGIDAASQIFATPPVMSLRGGDKAVWAGDALKFSAGEWSSTGEAPVQLTASGYIPVVGKSYTADTGALATLYPEEPSGTPSEAQLELYKCTAVDAENQTWSGRKAVMDASGNYVFIDNVTENLSYAGGLVPRKGKVYTADCKIRSNKAYNRCVCLCSFNGTTEEFSGNCDITLANQCLLDTAHIHWGAQSLVFNFSSSGDDGSGLPHEGYFAVSNFPVLNEFTIEFWDYCGRTNYEYLCSYVAELSSGAWITGVPEKQLPYKQWFHHAFVKLPNSSTVTEYVNGQRVGECGFKPTLGVSFRFYTMAPANGLNGNVSPNRWIDCFAVFDYAKYTNSFTPPTEPYKIEWEDLQTITLSGAGIEDVNGTYELITPNAAGTNRVWAKPMSPYVIKYNDDWWSWMVMRGTDNCYAGGEDDNPWDSEWYDATDDESGGNVPTFTVNE